MGHEKSRQHGVNEGGIVDHPYVDVAVLASDFVVAEFIFHDGFEALVVGANIRPRSLEQPGRILATGVDYCNQKYNIKGILPKHLQ